MTSYRPLECLPLAPVQALGSSEFLLGMGPGSKHRSRKQPNCQMPEWSVGLKDSVQGLKGLLEIYASVIWNAQLPAPQI